MTLLQPLNTGWVCIVASVPLKLKVITSGALLEMYHHHMCRNFQALDVHFSKNGIIGRT